MKKFLKIVAIVAVVLIAVALVVPLALKSKVGDIVEKEAGELLTAEVDFRSLDLSLLRHFPHASVELEGLTVVCAAPFEGDTLASVGRISVVVDLMSLFGDSGYEVTKPLDDKAHRACAQTRRRQRELGRDETLRRGGEGAAEADERRPSVCGVRDVRRVGGGPSVVLRTTYDGSSAAGRSYVPSVRPSVVVRRTAGPVRRVRDGRDDRYPYRTRTVGFRG